MRVLFVLLVLMQGCGSGDSPPDGGAANSSDGKSGGVRHAGKIGGMTHAAEQEKRK